MQLGDALPRVLRFVLSHTGLKAGLAARFRAILNILQHGGEIAVYSEPGLGSRFVFTLPLPASAGGESDHDAKDAAPAADGGHS